MTTIMSFMVFPPPAFPSADDPKSISEEILTVQLDDMFLPCY